VPLVAASRQSSGVTVPDTHFSEVPGVDDGMAEWPPLVRLRNLLDEWEADAESVRPPSTHDGYAAKANHQFQESQSLAGWVARQNGAARDESALYFIEHDFAVNSAAQAQQ
jgi:hypothetical protein